MNIAFIPIDNRPVCYTLPEQIAKCSSFVNLYIPDRELLGGLTKISDIEGILCWLKNLENIDAVVVCLDTIAYGGLIPSRRCDDDFDTILERVKRLKDILTSKNAEIYAFSSIMRISNNNINEEEKFYWDKWGKKIFQYSYNLHKHGYATTDIPNDILEDYLKTRKRNFDINKIYLNWKNEGFFDTLVFSKDDCAQYGLNVKEAKELENMGGFVKTGADEIPLSLLARCISNPKFYKISPIFVAPEHKQLISNYEDISVEQSVSGQIELAGCKVSNPEDADVLLYINNFEDHQGEIVMKTETKPYSGFWKTPRKPYMIADVRYANGADNCFVNKLLANSFDKNFLGYSGWNTTANTLGSLICCGKFGYLAERNDENFEKLQIVRLLDDWAYQANVRQMLKNPDCKLCKKFMKPFEEKIWQIFKKEYNVSYKFPWNRLFEVEIELG